MRPEYVALEHAHNGAVAGWADVGRYVPYRSITLHRFDTDGLPLIVRAKSIRRAIRRVEELDPEELGLTVEEASAIVAGSLTPELADALIQVAAIGRAVYEPEDHLVGYRGQPSDTRLTSKASGVVNSNHAGRQARLKKGKIP